eukprot:9301475-Pyramimonas_sp.AAC.1
MHEFKKRRKEKGDTSHHTLEHAEVDEFGASLIEDDDSAGLLAVNIELARKLEEQHDSGPESFADRGKRGGAGEAPRPGGRCATGFVCAACPLRTGRTHVGFCAPATTRSSPT